MTELTDTTGTSGEPVAVVGMACRFPGADDLQGFWRLLRRGGDAIGPGTGLREGRRPGGYLRDVELFDAELFGISPHEAALMDPQQRLLLELCWHALEDARIPPTAGGATGVFVGSCSDDYALMSRMSSVVDAYSMTGTARTFLANRLSYFFGFTGPSAVVDTGQSSSLAALDQALGSLRRGECTTAVVAGVQLNLTATGDRLIEELGAMSPTGRCHTFDRSADGIVRGEGAGVLVLKPLEAALAAGDRVYCTVLAAAVNNDGGGASLTTPTQTAQQSVLAQAYRRAAVDPAEVAYVELHGTGTKAGDPVEARALGGVLGRGRPADRPLLVGSVKTNIGHLEGAAGIAGLIKTAASLFHRELPPTLNHRRPNPDIDLDGLRLRVSTRRRAWRPEEGPLVCGVSSFGLGGTNAHAVLGEAPRREDAVPGPGEPGATADEPVPVLLSGHTDAALRAQAARLADRLDGRDDVDLRDLGLASATTRAALPVRAAVVASGRTALVARLRELADGTHGDGTHGDGTRDDGTTVLVGRPGAEPQDRPAPGDGPGTAAAAAAAAFVLGKPVDWLAVYGPGARPADLPPYAFQRRPYWLDTTTAAGGPAAEDTAPQWSGDPLDLVLDLTVEILGRAPGADLDLDATFTDLGLDSRMAVALRTSVARATGRVLPTTLLFDHPTPAALIEALRSDDTKGHEFR
ncbi:beta-ketoacyl synthase N-terminal-like domain-containing protein [Streptomyces sp. NBC_00199]|uniref:beta-ketoacyl synthase N-terminal-like domain-containing protein n=1 Tax=Streptomyces sp. NBC_00199 TaxID=2975678 RepID=UPI00225845FB|nr:beta-ketoacyl synthase N-terminal-like domain-containing protein [Streptomyces sp. NBC_00199]MCX5267322.1 beta-ketoacyl synthase N-terminal-like domain-containing protein [Streptomyces sp. NBC_00199]